MKKRRIIYGVCGIGLGHAMRQLPVITELAAKHRLHILAYGASLNFYRQRFADHASISISEVAVPYIVGSKAGLEFGQSAVHPVNQRDFNAINCHALEQARQALGEPDLAITDYEPMTAQYAYACSAPLITLDQQSKYLEQDPAHLLKGTSCRDEIMRLRMFFPKAEERLACSFFRLPAGSDVTLIPPVLNEQILLMKRLNDKPSILVYLSPQLEDGERVQQLICTLARQPDHHFHVFLSKPVIGVQAGNISVYCSGDKAFHAVLASCHGIISTAGHSLLSEAMYLGIPVLALPLKLYEQQMNAQVIAEAGFGLSADKLTSAGLRRFLENLPAYAKAIRQDRKVLLRGDGLAKVMAVIDRYLR